MEDAAKREAQEELEITIEIQRLVGVYSKADERVVLVVFEAKTLDAPQQTEEATEVRAFSKEEIPWDELAFWSTGRALRDFFAMDGS